MIRWVSEIFEMHHLFGSWPALCSKQCNGENTLWNRISIFVRFPIYSGNSVIVSFLQNIMVHKMWYKINIHWLFLNFTAHSLNPSSYWKISWNNYAVAQKKTFVVLISSRKKKTPLTLFLPAVVTWYQGMTYYVKFIIF